MTGDGVQTLSPSLPADVERLVEGVVREACLRRPRLATAESCTAGLIASALTDIDGGGHAFDRGFVVYTDAAKSELLGVDRELIARDGAVSEPVARAMAEGALERSEGDIAIAVTGFAGPGAPGEEAGLVHFACARRGRDTQVRCRRFGPLSRGAVRLKCLRESLQMLMEAMGGPPT